MTPQAIPKRGFTLMVILLLAIALSAIALVYTRHEARVLFMEQESLSRKRDALNTEYHRLQLEQSAYGAYHEIEARAPRDLGLRAPSPEEIYLIGDQGGYFFTGLEPTTSPASLVQNDSPADATERQE
ncbi:MAG: cell division protein FtsL [Pseudomonadota bacterium]